MSRFRNVWGRRPGQTQECLDCGTSVQSLRALLAHRCPPAQPPPARCPGCGSVGFGPSILGPSRCTFCDGTDGGHPPTYADWLPPGCDQEVAAFPGHDDASPVTEIVDCAGWGLGEIVEYSCLYDAFALWCPYDEDADDEPLPG